jgi:hypothetical protein
MIDGRLFQESGRFPLCYTKPMDSPLHTRAVHRLACLMQDTSAALSDIKPLVGRKLANWVEVIGKR